MNTLKENQVIQLEKSSWSDNYLSMLLKWFTGEPNYKEFAPDETIATIVKPRKSKFKRKLIRFVKLVLRFIVFGIENALEKKKAKKDVSLTTNSDENRFKS